MSQNIVSALGAGSGIDTAALVSSLVDVEKAAPQQRIDDKTALAETKISDFGLISSALSTLQDAAATLGDADTFNSKSASFTDSTAFIPISLDPEAQTGDYTFEVSQLAQSQSLSTDQTFENLTDEVGLGTLTFSFGSWDVATPPADPTTFTETVGSVPQTITIDNTNNSLTGLVGAINDADFGVQASVIDDGNGYKLVIRAASGDDTQLQITAAESGGSPTNTDADGLSRFAFNASDGSSFQMVQNRVGQDSIFTVNGLSVSRNVNTIDDVIAGFEFSLSSVTGSGESVNVTIEEDKATAEQTVRDFVEAYNLFLETLEPIIGYNEETEEYGSLSTDSLAKNIPSQIRALLIDEVTGLSSDSTYTLLSGVGIQTERDGTFSIDEDIFTEAVSNNYDAFKDLFVPATYSSTDQLTVTSFGDNTISGEYAVVITNPPSKGNLAGIDSDDNLVANLAADVATSAQLNGAVPTLDLTDLVASSGTFTAAASSIPLDLLTQGAGATDYDFSITVDGVTSAADISLPVADYGSYSAMATALQTAINDDANLSGVTVTYNTDRFEFSSSTTGASSSVSLSTVGASADELGISGGTATAGTGGANDYDFTIAVDGTTSGTISLTPGTYASFDELATEMQTQINADATLTGAGASVTVSHNGSQFIINSDSTGVSSTIANATAVGSEAPALGITSGSATQGAASGGNTNLYDFTISLNGTTSGTISLDTGNYADKDAIALALEGKINTDSALLAAGATVDVTYDSGSDSFTIESTRYGSSSSVSVTNVGANAADLGLAGGASTNGTDVAGSVDGVAAFGSGNILLPALGENSESLAIQVGENASSGSINFSRGAGGELQLLIEEFLSNTGVINSREESLNNNISDYEDDQETLDRRIEAYQERLTSQFIAMEAIVRSLQDSGSFLESTLSNLLDSYINSN